MKICCVLSYGKLSVETCVLLSQNTKFSSKYAVQALVYQQSKLKRLLHTTNDPKSYTNSPYSAITEAENRELRKDDANVQLVLYAGKIDLSNDNEKLRAHLQGMQCRVMELEKLCKKMKSQMAKFSKSKTPSHTRAMQPMTRFEATRPKTSNG
ncbi:hypothetical protein ACFX2B_011917 [Malus domestica]